METTSSDLTTKKALSTNKKFGTAENTRGNHSLIYWKIGPWLNDSLFVIRILYLFE